ncbi:MFS general substrate transporter [Mytilinidion resinicola]|uniref:MFS general substrate transporter n=1 Tax=Mytilinidion resinicola TaxID=574789 RepID=A0A6A6Y0X9_9PEZI|nr:MFS general substrate transporter [Mytilinidion resinicola]KAF2802422.1 MFS general substrate transporter [Mytilinidion resinicola]
MYSFIVLGLFQSSVGVMLQPLSQHYSLGDLHVSLIFIVGPLGYVIAAQSSDLIHCTWGQKGIAIFAPTLHILGALVIAAHPPFGIVLVAFAAVALGAGLLDGSWCAWAASGSNANTVSGLLQGSFSVGAAAGPFLAGTILPAWNRPWYDWYYFLVKLCVLFLAFRHENASKYRDEKHTEAVSTRRKINPRAMFKYVATWLIALYFLAYVGTETAISGWIVSFMTRHRNATPYVASMASSGFWGGMAVGRFTLGVVTDKLGVGGANIIYFLITIAFQVVFAFVQVPIASIVFMTLIGFFMGPMFASGIVILTRLLPAELHVAAVSFTASAGQVGAAFLPFGIGAFIQGMGIGVFRFAVVILSILALLAWVPVSRQRPAISSPSYEDHDEEGDSDPLLQ